VDCFRFSSQRILSFFSVGTRVGLIFFLSALQPLNLFPDPRLHGRQSLRKSLNGHRQTGMHQDPTDNVVLRTPFETLPDGSALYDANGLDILTVTVEFCCVVKDQSSGIGCVKPITR
jgi:hypothetical protein